MRTMRIALSCVASTLALVALSTGVALASGPDDEKTGSLLQGDGEIDVELDLDLEGDTKHDSLDADVDADAAAEIDLSDGKAVEADADVEANADIDVGGHKVLAPVDVDTDADADATVAVVRGGDRGSGGITALVRLPALLDVTVLDFVDATAASDLCAGLGIFADAPRCAVTPSGGTPDESATHDVTALVDAVASAGAIAGDVAGARGLAEACIGVGIGASAPTCTIASAPDDEGPDGTPGAGGEGVAPAEDRRTDEVSAPGGGEGAAPAEDRRTDEVSAPGGGELPDTALIGSVGPVLWALVMLVVSGLALGGRRRLRREVR
jgi:hypothetical protein